MELLHPWNSWTESLANALQEAGFAVAAADCSVPPKAELGDVSIPFFRLAKERGQPPVTVAEEAVRVLQGHPLVQEAVAAGPYINVRLSGQAFDETLAAIGEAGASYGCVRSSDQSEILFEYANPNTHKEIHIGHLRNFVTGVAYHGLWKAAGVNVQAVQFVNDQGVNVAKTLWMMVRKFWSESLPLEEFTEADLADFNRKTPSDPFTASGLALGPSIFGGRSIGDYYVEATIELERLGDTAKQEVSYVQAQLEAGASVWRKLWLRTRKKCLVELGRICREMGIVFDRAKPYLESDFLIEAIEIVDRLESKGIAQKSDGALVINLEEEKLGVCMVQKSDGNLLYLSKDLALAYQKKREYPKARKSFVLTDDRQALHFKQLNSVLQKLGYLRPYLHLGYGLLTLKEGTMSSRKGNVITYQALRDSLVKYAEEQTEKRHGADWTKDQIKATAKAIAFGGMKFALLKQSPSSIITFDREQALSFDGMTGPYCQYAAVRLESILKKAGGLPQNETLATNLAWEPSERDLLVAIGTLPRALERSLAWKNGAPTLEETDPATLAQWCFSTAQAVNAFYRDVPVLDAEPALRARRLHLANVAKLALTHGLHMLTIDVPTSM